MLDIVTYRIRIGTYNPISRKKHLYHQTKKTYNYHGKFNVSSYSYLKRTCLSLIFIFTLLSVYSWIPVDSRSLKNCQRGTHFTSLKYESEREQHTFNDIRTLQEKLCRSESHLSFFQKCVEKNIHPTNLDITQNFNIAFCNDDTKSRIQKINDINIREKLLIIINHFTFQSSKLKEEITEKTQSLKNICSAERFKFLSGTLNKFYNKQKDELSHKKSAKLRKLLSKKDASIENNTHKQNENSLENLPQNDIDVLLSGEELNDNHINAAMKLLTKQYPMITVQPPCLIQIDAYQYCPFETIQITHNKSHHWLLLSSLKNQIVIYDSLNTNPTPSLIKQINQLFSPDGSNVSFQQIKCVQQNGVKDCGVFAIAYATDILSGNKPNEIVYDQSKMREHLLNCFRNQKITPFPKYNCTNEKIEIINKMNKQEQWQQPRRSTRIQEKNKKSTSITLQNRFSPIKKLTPNSSKNVNKNLSQQKFQITDIVHNLSSTSLSPTEISLLEKGLNFCPTTTDPDKERLINDIYFFCRKLKLKEHFYSETDEEKPPSPQEKYETKPMKNPYYHPNMKTSPTLEKFTSLIKSETMKLLATPNRNKNNLTSEEKQALTSLKLNNDITIKQADKGGKVVIMNTSDYIKACENQLQDKTFYRLLDHDENIKNAEIIKTEITNLFEKNYISKKEKNKLSEHLDSPRTPLFYGLPKIHKLFDKFPPLRPIVSGYNSCTVRLSEYIDSFLLYQAQRCKSYIKDTKDFLNKLKDVTTLPNGTYLVTMDVKSLYTNIDHEEGAEACRIKLEERSNKTVPSNVIKRLILIVLKSNVFRLGCYIYKQIKGTAMGTPMAPNYSNLFMDNLENRIIGEFFKKTGKQPLFWFRFIDDIFFIWTYDLESLHEFLKFADNYTTINKMKSCIKFETNISEHSVNFLDVTISLKDGKLSTSLYTKPTNAHLYLNWNSCHPKHVLKNIPKGQFIRIKRICSETTDFEKYSKILKHHLLKRGYQLNNINEAYMTAKTTNRSQFLMETISKEKDVQSIFVCSWHPKLRKLPSILKNNYHILANDKKLSEIFKTIPTVAFRRKKTLGNFLVKTDTLPPKHEKFTTSPCQKCKFCPFINKENTIENTNKCITIKVKAGGNCQSAGVIYAARCKKHNQIYTGKTSETLGKRFSKHKYDILKRPENNELASHFNKDHDITKDLDFLILEKNIKNAHELAFKEDEWICRLQTLHPSGLNVEHGHYASEMYNSWAKIYNNNKN